MIFQKEINDVAEKLQVSKSTIDKDWALGHLINGIYQQQACQKYWIFKGGTCLRKCYFENYRFSEDLDFTIVDEHYELTQHFMQNIFDSVSQKSGILFSLEDIKEMQFDNQKTGYKIVVKFWGADHPKNAAPPTPERWQTSIKIELIHYEKMIFDVENHSLFHNYSDQNLIDAKVPCYSIAEVLSEKLRALIQRKYTAPRDYYDIWYLSQNVQDLDWNSIIQAFYQKMAYKGLEFEGMEQLLERVNEKSFKKHWDSSLGHHLPSSELPASDTVLLHLKELFEKLFM